MATTAQDVFEKAMALMDELDESSGKADTTDTTEYKNRTLPILNVLRNELYPFSDTYTVVTQGTRPIVDVIEDFSTAIGLDDYICQTVMPYGLAAHLLLTEDPTTAQFFNQRYAELFASLSRGMPAGSEEIEDIYGGIGHDWDGYWG